MTRRVLVIDDEPEFAAIVRKVAEESGYEANVAPDAAAFKTSYAAIPPDVIVLDIIMPEVDGIELVQWLIEQGCRADIVVVTGHNRNYARAAKTLAEARGTMRVRVLEKPAKLAELRAALAAAPG
jgi:CheY-like chemotaxis protein